MNTAYLLVTDLHYNARKEHRINYLGEVVSVLEQVLGVCNKYRAQGYSPKLIFLGDVIDSSMNTADDAMRCLDVFRFVADSVDGVYTVLGNHEQHNIKGNPFWYLVSNLEDPALSGLMKAIQPQSLNGVFSVPDTIQDGNLTIYFNHYGIAPKVPEGVGVHIGLFHQNVGSAEITKMWGAFDDVEKVSYVRSYNYCYFGHMHLAQGKYYIGNDNTCIGEWLGSCVGTNITEVQELPSELNIPTILVQDGKFISVEDNYVKRVPFEEAVDQQKLRLTQNTKELIAASKELAIKDVRLTTLFDQVAQVAKENNIGYLVTILQMSPADILSTYKRELSAAVAPEVTTTNDGVDVEYG